ncbi:MAG TPA: PAS domain-containing protein [Caulobacteraceae bacterium]|nr:PAS domain-containing protein [Caulobacteraceae bacterium]
MNSLVRFVCLRATAVVLLAAVGFGALGWVVGARAPGGPALLLGVTLALGAVVLAVTSVLQVVTAATSLVDQAARHAPAGLEGSGFAEFDAALGALRRAVNDKAELQERFELAAEVGGIGAWDWDVAADEGRVSPSYKKMHGLEHVEGPLRLKQVVGVIHPDDRTGYLERLAGAAKRPEASTNEYRVVLPDGSVGWVSAKGRPLFDQRGEMVGAIGIVRDVTAERAALAAIEQSEQRLRLALSMGRMAVWEHVADGDLLHASPEFGRLIGYADDQPLSAQMVRDHYHPDDREAVATATQSALSRGEHYVETEFRLYDLSGDLHWLMMRADVLARPDGTPARTIGILLDITDRKRWEERQQLLLNELNHRVKNTLAVVQALARQSFKPGRDPGDARAAFEARLTALSAAHDVLTQRHWEPADLGQLVETSFNASTGLDGARLDCRGPPLLLAPQTAVSVVLAVHELATNAVKHGALSGPAGAVEVSWSVEDEEPGAAGRLRFCWRERGGPSVSPPKHTGFGLRMLEQGLARELRGQVQIKFDPEGLRCELEAPLPPAPRPRAAFDQAGVSLRQQRA